MYPIFRVTLFQICFQRAVNCLLRVDGFLNALPANHRQPRLKRLGFLGGNGLDDAQKLFGVSNVRCIVFPVFRRTHFQLVTRRNQLTALFYKPVFQHFPVVSGMVIVWLASQDCNHVHDGKIPFLPRCIPRHADFLVFE